MERIKEERRARSLSCRDPAVECMVYSNERRISGCRHIGSALWHSIWFDARECYWLDVLIESYLSYTFSESA